MIEVRRFSPRYQDEAAALINGNLGARFGEVNPAMNPDLFDIAATYGERYFMLALRDQVLVGTGALVPREDGTAEIVRMHTHPEHRRLGIASRLLADLESLARREGRLRLLLETNLDWHDAIAFYLTEGYVELARNDVGIRFGKQLSRPGP